MNRIFSRKVSIIIVLVIISIATHAQISVTFKVRNFTDNEGVCVVNLFREQDDLPEKPFKISTGSIVTSAANVTFVGLPRGEYAAIVYHDKNANGVLDHRFGFPNEPMGFSNNWNLSLFSGMPTFKKLKLSIESDVVIELSVR